MSAQPEDPRTRIPGWGADLNLRDRPAVPKEGPSNVHTLRGTLPPQQVSNVRIHRSIEHVGPVPVFGTTCPPKGVSGKIRDVAYGFSEARLAHWMLLLLADRIDVFESIATDAAHGKVPHPMHERGWKTRLTHRTDDQLNRTRNKIVIGGLIVAVAAVATAAVVRSMDE